MVRLTRRERIRLLLSSYADAAGPSRNPADVRGAPSSKAPPSSPLWDEGSYYQLDGALARLRDPCPKIHRHTRGFYITREPWARKATAEKGITLLMDLMPANVFVPQEVSENAGFLPSESRAAARSTRAAA